MIDDLFDIIEAILRWSSLDWIIDWIDDRIDRRRNKKKRQKK